MTRNRTVRLAERPTGLIVVDAADIEARLAAGYRSTVCSVPQSGRRRPRSS